MSRKDLILYNGQIYEEVKNPHLGDDGQFYDSSYVPLRLDVTKSKSPLPITIEDAKIVIQGVTKAYNAALSEDAREEIARRKAIRAKGLSVLDVDFKIAEARRREERKNKKSLAWRLLNRWRKHPDPR